MSNVESALSQRDVVNKLSPRSVDDTVSRLTDMVTSRGMKLFAVINQSAEALEAGLELSPRFWLHSTLPLKVLVCARADGEQTKVSYYSPASLAALHHLSDDLAEALAGSDPLSDALIAP